MNTNVGSADKVIRIVLASGQAVTSWSAPAASAGSSCWSSQRSCWSPPSPASALYRLPDRRQHLQGQGASSRRPPGVL
ncbi:MAG: hypothetical protein R2734_09870 [Nocardioides sp.]